MLFMVIERFKKGQISSIGERFAKHGRMLPDGVSYCASWLDPDGTRCFQVMDAPSAESLSVWTERWKDVMEFEIIPVETSSEFWAERRSEQA